MAHYGSRAIGGAGLIMWEATGVSPVARISPGDCGMWTDAQAEAFKPLTKFIRDQGCVAAVQLAHAGRKASVDVPSRGAAPLPPSDPRGWQTLAPSALAFQEGWPVPKAMTEADLRAVVGQFEEATRRSLQAGFQVVEIHMAHGYLLHEFLSPLTNVRTDAYGGSLENRMRFPLEVARAVRKAWPEELPVFVRISATDWVEGGWDLAQSIAFVRELKAVGIDVLDCSTGGLVHDAKIPVAPGFQVPFAEKIRAETGILTTAVGCITEAKQADELVARGKADAIFIGRAFLREAQLPLRWAQELGAAVAWPWQYERGKV